LPRRVAIDPTTGILGETNARAVNLPCACPVTDLVY
jgi:hypothetical protein